MIGRLKKDMQVLISDTNSVYEMGISNLMYKFQDLAALHSQDFGFDNLTLREKSNAFWVILRCKIHIDKTPKFLDNISVETWPNMPKYVRCNRNFVIRDADGQPIIRALTEWALLDADTHGVRRFSSTIYPMDEEHLKDTAMDEPFRLGRMDFGSEDLVYTSKVMSSDIDVSQHTNNVTYCRYLLNAFDSSFFSNNKITDFEINYRHESREGDLFEVYKKETPDGITLQASNPDGKVYASALIKYEPR